MNSAVLKTMQELLPLDNTNAETCGSKVNDSNTAHDRSTGLFYRLSKHAFERMQVRGIEIEAIEAALAYGRVAHVRGAKVFAIGQKEVEHFDTWGLDLAQHSGVQVVCSGKTILTVYRNHDFRGLRRKKQKRSGSKKQWHFASMI